MGLSQASRAWTGGAGLPPSSSAIVIVYGVIRGFMRQFLRHIQSV